jgi:hypothetical protein
MKKKPDGKQVEILFSWCGSGHAPIKLHGDTECPICAASRRVAEFNSRPRTEFDFETETEELRAECYFAMDNYSKEMTG